MDDINRFAESDENNNKRSLSFTVGSPPPAPAAWSTGFEPGQPGGTLFESFPELFRKDMTGQADNTVAGEAAQWGGADSFAGLQQNRIMGSATSTYGYVYYKLADVDIPVVSGTRLRYSAWFDTHPGSHPIGVDLKFSDGTWMRDGGFRDQNGINAHPNARNVYPARQWLTFTIDLSPKSGKSVRQVSAAYDNGLTGAPGVFRGYVDAIFIGPP